VVANDASGNGAKLSMPGDMTRHPSDDSAFDASLCFGAGGREHNASNGNGKN
jgi:hypothetical protein